MTPASQPSLLRASTFYFAFAFLILAGAVLYGVFQYRILEAEAQALEDNTGARMTLTGKLNTLDKEYKIFAEDRTKKDAEIKKTIESILPSDENYIELTRQLDDFFDRYDRPGKTIFQSSLRFEKSGPVKDFPGISALPVNMNIEATRENILQFLDFANNSGSLETGTRLMEINSIRLNFLEGGEVVKDLSQKLSVTVDMTAYYRTPKVAR